MSATPLAQDAPAATGNNEEGVSVAATPAPEKSKPFVGLVPLGEENAKLLAGREDEVRVLATNLRAARLTLVYGASGVGKSSILRAGVVASLRKLSEEELNNFGAPSFAVAIMGTWAGDSFAQLADSVSEGIKRAFDVETLPPAEVSTDLVEMLRTFTNSYGVELLIILDQFEEFFLYHDKEEGPGSFAYEFPRAVNTADLRVRFLVSLRDDSLYKLDRFQQSLPTLFENRLQVVALTIDNARQAMLKAVAAYNETETESTQVQIEDKLIDEVLTQVRTNNLGPDVVIRGVLQPAVPPRSSNLISAAAASLQTDGFIDAPYMQLVMSRLWDEESAHWEKDKPVTRSLRLETLERLGSAQAVVQQHLDKVLLNFTAHEREIAYDCFYHLVTPSGSKYALTPSELDEYTNHKAPEIKEFLEKLADNKYRIMRRVDKKGLKGTETAYEAYHDRLALAMLAWRARKEDQRELRRKRIRVAFISGIVLIILAVPTLYLLSYVSTRVNKWLGDINKKEKEVEEKEQKVEETIANANSGTVTFRNAAEEAQTKLDKVKNLLPKFTCRESSTPGLKQDAEQINTVLEIDCSQAGNPDNDPAGRQMPPRIYLHIQTDEQQAAAINLKEWLQAQRFAGRRTLVPSIENVGPRKLRFSQLRYFHDNTDELGVAWQITNSLQKLCINNVMPQLIKGYENSPAIRPRHFELWLTLDALNNYRCINNTSVAPQ